jgi:hypothetical protein
LATKPNQLLQGVNTYDFYPNPKVAQLAKMLDEVNPERKTTTTTTTGSDIF